MAHYAVLDENNIVVNVFVGPDESDDFDWEQFYVDEGFGDKIKRTSYNTHGGVHELGGVPFRMNYAEIGGEYREDLDAFIPVKIYKAWVLNEETCTWEAPFPPPGNHYDYFWDDETDSWVQDSQI